MASHFTTRVVARLRSATATGALMRLRISPRMCFCETQDLFQIKKGHPHDPIVDADGLFKVDMHLAALIM